MMILMTPMDLMDLSTYHQALPVVAVSILVMARRKKSTMMATWLVARRLMLWAHGDAPGEATVRSDGEQLLPTLATALGDHSKAEA